MTEHDKRNVDRLVPADDPRFNRQPEDTARRIVQRMWDEVIAEHPADPQMLNDSRFSFRVREWMTHTEPDGTLRVERDELLQVSRCGECGGHLLPTCVDCGTRHGVVGG